MLSDLLDSYRDSASPRVAKCQYLVLQPKNDVEVRRRVGAARCYLGNVMRCGNVNECPPCQAQIKAERAKEAEAVKAWHVAQMYQRARVAFGWDELECMKWAESTAVMITLTVRHGLGDDLETIRTGVANAWKKFQQGRSWVAMKAELDVVGTIRALEVTWGRAAGYHPHLHIAAFFRRPPNPELQSEIFERWRSCVVATLGEEHAPIAGIETTDDQGAAIWKPVGVVVTACNQANYLAKLGLEISAPNTKQARDGHYTPLDFLAHFAECQRQFYAIGREYRETGDMSLLDRQEAVFNEGREWLNRYRAYAKAMRGAKQLTWSRGLKAAAAITEKSDEQVVAGDAEADELVARVPAESFKLVRRAPGGVGTMLELAELHGPGAVADYVRHLTDQYNETSGRLARQKHMRGMGLVA